MGNPMRYHENSIIYPSSLVFRPVSLSVKWFTVNSNNNNKNVLASLPHSLFIFSLHNNNRLHWYIPYWEQSEEPSIIQNHQIPRGLKTRAPFTNYIPLVLWLYHLLTANLPYVLRKSFLTTMELITFAFI